MIYLLQVCRGLAALFVVLFHASARIKHLYGIENHLFLDFFSFGDAGVQFFFVLSGFIIFHVHRNDIGRPNKIPGYLKKRIIRIYPIYILVTLLVFPAWYFLPSIGFPYHQNLNALIFSLLLIPQEHAPHLGVAWALIHEMLFYLLFAIAIAHRKVGSIIFIAWFILIVMTNFPMEIELLFPLNFLFSINNLLFGLGIGVAMFTGKYSFNNRGALITIVMGSILFILTGIYVNNLRQSGTTDSYMLVLIIIFFGFSSSLLLLQANNQAVQKFMKNRKILLVLGNASYSIYLIHVPALSLIVRTSVFLKLEAILPFSVLFVLSSMLVTVFGILLYLKVEKSILKWLRAKWIQQPVKDA